MFYLGLDLGQRRDHSAIAVIEKRNALMLVRHLERVALGTPYPAVVERVGRADRLRKSDADVLLELAELGLARPGAELGGDVRRVGG